MIGVSLSRWTVSYFAAALLWLVVAEAMMALGYGFPHAALRAPETLILVHAAAIGWLSLLMCGALLQFVPVLVAQPLYSDSQARLALASLVAGLVALILGFLQLAGRIAQSLPFLTMAAGLLGFGFALVLWNLARTLWAAPAWPVPARFVVVGLASAAATVTLGIIFALGLDGTIKFDPFLALGGSGLPLHVIAGLGGWLTFTAIGVSYRLLAMFMLAPELERSSTKAALSLGAAALGFAVLGGVIAILLGTSLAPLLAAAGGLGLVALILYGIDVLHLYRARKRPQIELNSRMAAFALASLAASVILTVALTGLGRLEEQIGALVFLVVFGWLSGLGLAQLYKIVAFLTWLECYGPVLGKAPTPRVQDLVVEPRAIKWFWLYFLAVWAGTAALLAGFPPMFQVCAAAMLVATAGIVAQLVRTRRLADVAGALRIPQGSQRPRLLSSLSHQT